MKPGIPIILSAILCGIPGIIACLAGCLTFLFGFLSDAAQLKLDTNLERSRLILTGIEGIVLGLILIAIPVGLWLVKKRRKNV